MKNILLLLFFLSCIQSVNGQERQFYFTTSDSVSLFVRVAGKGVPCLFLHGGPGSTSHYFEALTVAKRLEESLQMIYFDQRGSGRSGSSQKRDYSITRMEKDIEEIREFLQVEQWAVMGHSFAGILMTSYARHYHQRISRLIYVHCTLNIEGSFTVSVKEGERLLKRNHRPVNADKNKPVMEQLMIVNQALEKEDIRYKMMFRTRKTQRESDSLTNAATYDFNRDYASSVWQNKEYFNNYNGNTSSIQCPVLIISGRKDYAAGPKNFRYWSFPNKRVKQYSGGHVSFQEEPRWFARHVIRFLAKGK